MKEMPQAIPTDRWQTEVVCSLSYMKLRPAFPETPPAKGNAFVTRARFSAFDIRRSALDVERSAFAFALTSALPRRSRAKAGPLTSAPLRPAPLLSSRFLLPKF